MILERVKVKQFVNRRRCGQVQRASQGSASGPLELFRGALEGGKVELVRGRKKSVCVRWVVDVNIRVCDLLTSVRSVEFLTVQKGRSG